MGLWSLIVCLGSSLFGLGSCVLSCVVLSCVVLSCLISSCLILSYLVLSCLVSCLVSFHAFHFMCTGGQLRTRSGRGVEGRKVFLSKKYSPSSLSFVCCLCRGVVALRCVCFVFCHRSCRCFVLNGVTVFHRLP